VAVLTGAISVLAAAANSALAMGVIITLIFLPLVQLAASILTLIWIQIRSADPADKSAGLRTLGRITLWSFVGAGAGLVLMIFGFKMFNP
jgi:hypothetical protein